MAIDHPRDRSSRKPLRLWPGVAAVVVLLSILIGVPIVAPDQGIVMMLTSMASGVVVLVWWMLFSRAPWLERLAAIALIAVGVTVSYWVVHPSIANGMMSNMPIVFSIPVMSIALVAWAVISRDLAGGARRTALLVAVALGVGALSVIRTNGIGGDGIADLEWRWTPDAEQRLLARGGDEPVAPPAAAPATAPPAPAPAAASTKPAPVPTATDPASEKPAAAPSRVDPAPAPSPAPAETASTAEWPGFRGAGRNAVVPGLRIVTDWSLTPPVELWRRQVGPGWSSFAVRGDRVYTQEQRGDDEVVSAYDLKTGAPVWRHRDAARFWESNAGAGPRGTPTVSGDRVYTHGATGIVNALNARDGSVAWSRNASTDTGAPMPGWGFSSSPLVVKDLIVVASSGRLIAYEVDSGRPRWQSKAGGGSYSSPHLMTIDGVEQILLPNGAGIASFAAADGAVLWQYAWEGVPMLQPGRADNGDLLISSGDMMGGVGIKRVTVARGAGGWTTEERWASRGLKPYFSDFVIHKGHAFGFDGSILSCINLADGERKWKGGRYGTGQMMLLADQDLLIVVAEEGEIALVSATPDKFTEVARVPAIEGKTWNHPALAGNVLLVRNGEEMAAFRLPLAKDAGTHDTSSR